MEKTVLVVEDDLELRDILQDILEGEGYDVVPATDGHQALEYLRTIRDSDERPALMILDLMMPLVSGWQVLDELRADPSLQLPTIVVSASGAKPEGAQAIFLHKPFSLDELLDTVHERC